MNTGTIEERLDALVESFENRVEALNLARLLRLQEFEDGFITVEELFSDPPENYIRAAVEARDKVKVR